MRRITKAALGGLAGCALVLGGTQAATGISSNLTYDYDDQPLVNLDPAGPFDGPLATLSLAVKVGADGNTNFVLDVTGIDPTAAGQEFGAHLHTKACEDLSSGVDRPGGPHYNHEVVTDSVSYADAEKSRRTEVWFDLVPSVAGVARDSTTVKFVPVDGDRVMSIVLHSAATANKTGLAGDRGACFTLLDAEWAKTAL